MNLSELSKLDVKDLNKINYSKFGEHLKKNPQELVTTLIVIGAIVFSAHFYINKKMESRRITIQINDLLKKKVAMTEYNNAKKSRDDLLNNLPQGLSADTLANVLTTMAIHRGVRLESFSPAKKIDEPLYELTSINLEISSKEYDNIFLFIHDIESSQYNIRIEDFQSTIFDTMVSQRRQQPQQAGRDKKEERPEIRIQMEIASIIFKNENK
ncbi:MAG TPA: type 4a pilus biogenesis protein PilO [Candidatus Omnitrophota bacterium]|jgi:Tfp pilus assembly protein PilO|nr:type 4a pilus biogenesis protein PilO [Candidatus Omnitrophota bacterium]HPN56332.1 type 4a pilus biogenesis protein PilO [Candidatus Omnitrophota bacterium]